MSRLIDADRLKEVVHRNTVGDLFDQFVDMQPTVKAIPLDKAKQAIEEISDWDVNKVMDGCSEPFRLGVARGLDIASEILDKLIAESEDKE
jgi:hypothetical protein